VGRGVPKSPRRRTCDRGTGISKYKREIVRRAKLSRGRGPFDIDSRWGRHPEHRVKKNGTERQGKGETVPKSYTKRVKELKPLKNKILPKKVKKKRRIEARDRSGGGVASRGVDGG